MASLNRSHAEKMAHRLSVEIFGEHFNDQTLNPPHMYYQHIPQQYYPSQWPINLNYNLQITSFSVE
jgi:hypothetical protein